MNSLSSLTKLPKKDFSEMQVIAAYQISVLLAQIKALLLGRNQSTQRKPLLSD